MLLAGRRDSVLERGDGTGSQELCILLDSILALLETDNTEKAKKVIKNGIKRIDRGMTSSSTDKDQD